MPCELLATLATAQDYDIEGAIAHEAATLIVPADIAELNALQDEMKSAVLRKDSKRYLVKNQDFHFTLYRSAGIGSAVDIIETLWLRIGPSLNFLLSGPASSLHKEGRSGHLLDDHGEILIAIKDRDCDAVRHAVERDINEGMKVLIEQAAH